STSNRARRAPRSRWRTRLPGRCSRACSRIARGRRRRRAAASTPRWNGRLARGRAAGMRSWHADPSRQAYSAIGFGSMKLAARMGHIEAFEVMEIQTLARDCEARGMDVIHMEIGEPDFRTPQPIVDAAKRALDEQRMYYTSALGMMELREA